MFVVFEGIDGSGKTSISNRVAAELGRQGRSVKHLRAEGRFASPIVEGIREFARNSQHLELCWEAEFLLYVARDVQLMNEMLRPALACHEVVLADRFLYTSEVLARHARGLGESFVRPILTAAADGIEPDLVIWVDVEPAIANARRKLRKLGGGRQGPPARRGVDSPEAWTLREASYDIWPSSVVKTLGPLADAERGRAVIERQLAAYPEDVSLLKHVARIALGLHRAAPPPAQ